MNKQKFMLYFLIYTIATFVIGIVMKLALVGFQGHTLSEQFTPTAKLDPDHTRHIAENGGGLATQVILVIATIIAYPASMIKLYKMVTNPSETWTAKVQKRLFIEYLVFLIFFIIFDLAAIGIVVAEHAPMEGWVLFAIISVFFPTSFAIGSLLFLRKSKKFVAVK